ncbi:MAG: RNA-binding S4 domain-containing protein [Burkholderiaceae bacterium]
MSDSVRIDKWLWASRFFKTRSMATDAIDGGKVRLNGERCKPSRNLKIADVLDIDNGSTVWQVQVAGLSDKRGPAAVAQLLYAETAAGLQQRLLETERRKLFSEPGADIKGRPTKRDRRQLDRSRD